MLLEPTPMLNWMKSQKDKPRGSWYSTLMGGQPLFDDAFANQCKDLCKDMVVWTGYRPAIQPFDTGAAVNTYVQALHAQNASADAHNEFTEGAYLGTRLFIEACRKVGANLTREALKAQLDMMTFDSGMTARPVFFGTALPRIGNDSLAAFSDNSAGNFNGWNYLSTDFLQDPSPGMDG
jgi:ABC-type branched-subunit amino acid transport system substrate-binding protein